jgi:hypothetical protein
MTDCIARPEPVEGRLASKRFSTAGKQNFPDCSAEIFLKRLLGACPEGEKKKRICTAFI